MSKSKRKPAPQLRYYIIFREHDTAEWMLTDEACGVDKTTAEELVKEYLEDDCEVEVIKGFFTRYEGERKTIVSKVTIED